MGSKLGLCRYCGGFLFRTYGSNLVECLSCHRRYREDGPAMKKALRQVALQPKKKSPGWTPLQIVVATVLAIAFIIVAVAEIVG